MIPYICQWVASIRRETLPVLTIDLESLEENERLLLTMRAEEE
jgi:hypothetical protein